MHCNPPRQATKDTPAVVKQAKGWPGSVVSYSQSPMSDKRGTKAVLRTRVVVRVNLN